MASAAPDSDPEKEECGESTYTVQDMQRLQAKFADEAIRFLSQNCDMFVYPNQIQNPRVDNYPYPFTRDVAKAIMAIAYIHRIDYRKRIRRIFRADDAEAFRRHVMAYPIFKTDTYFYHFLSWVAFAFEFTVYCYMNGRDYYSEARRCIASYPDLEYFHSRGGWGQLFEFSSLMAMVFDRLEGVIALERSSDDVLLPFMKVIESIERQERYRGTSRNLTSTQEMRILRGARRILCTKYDVISTLDSNRVTAGYKVRMKKSPVKTKTLEEISPKAAETMKRYNVKPNPERAEYDDLAEKLEMTRIAAELADRSRHSEDEYQSQVAGGENVRPDEADETKSVFIINEKFLEKLKAQKATFPTKKKPGLKIYSPSKATGRLSTRLNHILEKNIESKNYSKVEDDVYAVCPPGCELRDEATRVIVMDTSSEEEDEDYFDIGTQIERAVKIALARCIRKQNEKLQKLLRQYDNESESNSEASDSSVPEQVQNVPTKCTGAIPKIRVHAPPPDTEKDSLKKTQTVHSENSSANNPECVPTKSTKKKSSRRKKKKSKK